MTYWTGIIKGSKALMGAYLALGEVNLVNAAEGRFISINFTTGERRYFDDRKVAEAHLQEEAR